MFCESKITAIGYILKLGYKNCHSPVSFHLAIWLKIFEFGDSAKFLVRSAVSAIVETNVFYQWCINLLALVCSRCE